MATTARRPARVTRASVLRTEAICALYGRSTEFGSLKLGLAVHPLFGQVDLSTESMDVCRRLFDRHVADVAPRKAFAPEHVTVEKGGEHESTRLKVVYSHDDVFIYYLSRLTWKRDDYDIFVDTTVAIDGEIIVNRVKE
jgi:hypothetical protein